MAKITHPERVGACMELFWQDWHRFHGAGGTPVNPPGSRHDPMVNLPKIQIKANPSLQEGQIFSMLCL